MIKIPNPFYYLAQLFWPVVYLGAFALCLVIVILGLAYVVTYWLLVMLRLGWIAAGVALQRMLLRRVNR